MSVSQLFMTGMLVPVASIVLVALLRRYSGIVSVITLAVSFITSLVTFVSVSGEGGKYIIEVVRD